MRSKGIFNYGSITNGLIFSLFAYFFVALMGELQKLLPTSTPIVLILLSQNVVCLILSIPWVYQNGFKIKNKQQHKVYAIRILSGVVCYALLFILMRYIPISESLLFQYSASIWIPFVSLCWLKDKMSLRTWVSIIVGFIGIIFLLEPQSSILHWLLIIGVCCGFLQAVSIVAVKKLTTSEPISRILFYYFLVGTIITLPLSVSSFSALSFATIYILVAIGAIIFFAQFLIALSLRYCSASTIAPMCYFSILFSGCLDWFFWHKHPSDIALIGMLLIIFGGLFQAYMRRTEQGLGFPENSDN
jgi:drug/metabolite transporter (DMT)-like permease